jgi:hypothetical protein
MCKIVPAMKLLQWWQLSKTGTLPKYHLYFSIWSYVKTTTWRLPSLNFNQTSGEPSKNYSCNITIKSSM